MTQPNVACSEHDLVAATRRGDDRAFEQLYSRYRSRITAYIAGMVHDHARAEDIVQEVFISALRRLRETERPVAFKPWIYEIAKNACIDDFRRTRRAREVPLDSENDEGDGGLPARGPTPDAEIQNKQSLDDLRGAFHGLSENHHKLIVMRELEGLSYEQIGERLGMSRPMVESTLFRARRKLTEEYNELVSGRRCEHVQTLIASEERRSLLKLGVRERRQLARHLAHCQPCRREARMARLDESFFQAPRTLAGKIAALLPIPWLRWRRGQSGGGEDAVSASVPHSHTTAQSLQNVAQMVDPTGPFAGLGRAAAAVAAIAIAGIGGGVVTTITSGAGTPRHAVHSVTAKHAAPVVRHPAKPRPRFASHAVKASGGGAAARSRTRSVRKTAAVGSGSGTASGATTNSSTGTSSSGGTTTQSGSSSGGGVQGVVKKVVGAAGGATKLATGATTQSSTLSSVTGAVSQTVQQTSSALGSTVSQVQLPDPNQAVSGVTHLGG